ncbi:MAG TPA: TetR family transcriptional regulator [Burkholderiaceae bacterium]|jgi:ubiquinone biosynthesis protein COQ9|nr:TetR family transcriptional regulator [Burkholderiaceae bacterium]
MTIPDRIVDAALEIAGRSSWEALRLHQVADALGITLDALRAHFREKEDLVDAWFDRADAAMLREAEQPGFLALTSRQRLQRLIWSWLTALAPHRAVTRQMICGKLEPGHLHVQIPGLLRVSRTVQWIREAAHRDATFVRRALEETALTSIYLTTFAHWLHDESVGSQRTARLLDALLATAEQLDHAVYRRGAPGRSAA